MTAGNNNNEPDLALNGDQSRLKWLLLAGVITITFFCYSYTLQNQFTGWDDDTYVTYNKYITSFSGANLEAMLFKDITQNYHHPITMLSLAFNYHFSQLNPFSYYLTNVIIHLLNLVLIFFLVNALLEAMAKKGHEEIQNKYWLSALCALWYGIHPMHVESVAWITERKDLLYAFFYFLGMIYYLRYIENKQTKWMVFVFICYVLSCLSKPMAVVFPVSLLAIDVLLKRKIELKLLIEKSPLFLFSLGAGILAFVTADKTSVASFQALTLGQRLMFPSYGFTMYSFKAIVPLFLSSFYPYPDLSGPPLPFIFYIAPFIASAIVLVPLYIARKRGENVFRIVVFGLGFYLANLIFVLQFVSVGRTIMSDRYSYVAYFGLIFMLLYFAFLAMSRKPELKTPVHVTLVCFSLAFAILCTARTRVWHSSETLWRNVAENYPLKIGEAYESLGNYYYLSGNMDSAYTNFKILSGIYYRDPYVFNKLGNICMAREDYNGALAAFSRSLLIDSTYYFSYVDRGGLYSKLGKFSLALPDYVHAYRIQPNDEKVLLNKGAAELNTGDINSAITDFNRVLALDPNNATSLYALSLAYNKGKDYESALKYAVMATDKGFSVPKDYVASLQKNTSEKNK
jgi:Flp pilus assembly protein TadD